MTARLRMGVVALAMPLLMGASPGELIKVSGHVKAFGVGSVPYQSRLFSGPTGSAVVDARLKLAIRPWKGLTFEYDPTLTASLGGAGGVNTGVGLTAPELLSMTAQIVSGPSFGLRFRVDRALVRADLGPVRLTVGRQAITFGQGQLFTPMDLVAPFNPAVLDQSYKPGVDAFRGDVFLGMSGQISAVVAYLGEESLGETGVPDGGDPEPPELADVALALHGQGTAGTVDLGGFVGAVYGDFVGGVSVYAPIGPVGLYGDVTLTVVTEEEPMVYPRAVVGVVLRPTTTTTLMVEVYGQRFGTDTKSEYLLTSMSERYQRGELWLAGHLYASVLLAQEITPLVSASALVVANLLDPSALLMGSVSWSVASNADLAAGVQMGVGKRPDELVENPLASGRSEFGIVPVTGFVQVGVYF